MMGGDPERQEAAERACAVLVRLLAETTAEGLAFRVDHDAPAGGQAWGAVRSLEAMREYYATQAATWERQA